MNKPKIPFFFLLKWLIVILAIVNLIWLFVFNYQLPGFLRSDKTSSDSSAEYQVTNPDQTTSETADALLQIHVPEDPLFYDGSVPFDLMDGVSVTDLAGSPQPSDNIFSIIKSGSTRKEKIIEYSVTDANGTRITTQRPLQLGDSYSGPSITLQGELPQLSSEDIPVLVSLLINKGLLHADDGFGKDVSSSVTSAITTPADESGNAIVTLTITNLVNDSYSTDVLIFTGINSGPRIELTTNRVTLERGEGFSFYNYIQSAKDIDGNDLHNRITVNGNVDTSVSGTYTLEFYCTDENGNKSNTETLTVIVQ